MTQRFQEDGQVMPVTVVAAGPCCITQVKNSDKEGYDAVQIGYGEKKKLNKSILGHLKKLGQFRDLKEFHVDKTEGLAAGQKIDVSTFTVGDKIQVVGISKGKGFQGVVKRHGFSGTKATHGNKDQLRMPGSIGATDAARVFKGKRMGGQTGNRSVTVKNLEVIEIDPENNYLYIKGAVPGARNSLLMITAEGELKFAEPKKNEEINDDKTDNADSKEDNKEKETSAKEETNIKENKDNKKEAKVEEKKEVPTTSVGK